MQTLNDYASRVNRRLNEIPAVVAEDRFEIGEMPWLLSQSMRYSLSAGGKRLRPSMLLAAVASFSMGMLAWALGRLLTRAVQYKEENDLTI